MTPKTPATNAESQASGGVERTGARAVFRPRVDIIEGKDAILLVADVPGTDENETEITLENNVLTIRATVPPLQLERYTMAYQEYGVGDFERAFTISDEINRDGIEAVVKHGVLHVTLPKSKQGEAKKIAVNAG